MASISTREKGYLVQFTTEKVNKCNKTGSYSKCHNSLKARPGGLAFYRKIRIVSYR